MSSISVIWCHFPQDSHMQFALSTLQAAGRGILRAVYTSQPAPLFPLSFPADFLNSCYLSQGEGVSIRIECTSQSCDELIHTLASLGADSVKKLAP